MKHTLIFILFISLAIPCHAQWKNANFGDQVLAFGVHDTSFFVGSVPYAPQDPLVFRFDPTNPSLWADATTGIDPSQENVTSFASLGPYLFAGMTRTDNGAMGALYRSSNDGVNWSLVQSFAPAFTNGRYLFGNGFSSAYRSRDTGVDWDTIALAKVSMYASIGICIFANTSNAIWRSTDTGNNWTKLSPPFLGTMTVMDSLLFMVGGNGKLAESTDSGTQWTTIQVDSIGVAETVNCLTTDGKNLFAGTPTGVLVSTDAGKDWKPENDSLPSTPVTALGVFDTLLFADVNTNAADFPYQLYMRSIPAMLADTNPASVVQALARDSIEVYPNPATGIVTILSAGTSFWGVSMLNVLGEVVFTLPNPYQSNVSLDVSKLPAGTYFVHIQMQSRTVLRKVILER
jgi:Secretion system C-terminal sorting domain